MMMRRMWVMCAVMCGVLGVAGSAYAVEEFEITASTRLGGLDDDESVTGVAVRRDGKLVVALNTAPLAGESSVTLAGADAMARGAVMLLSVDGTRVEKMARVSADGVWDMALTPTGEIVLAAGDGGVIVLTPDLDAVSWSSVELGHVRRVDADAARVVALAVSDKGGADNTPGEGRVHLFERGELRSSFSGYRNTLDVAVHDASQRIVTIGWRQANAFDGNKTNPVQIAYMRGTDFDGDTAWTNYDWSTDRESDRFLNRETNNMADTRGYRVTLGAQGDLYAAFESAGGNHIFRYEPGDLGQSVSIVGGDAYHEFYNTASEHKTFLGKYDINTGAYLTGQQFTGRLSSGKGNTLRVKEGDIAVDELGRVYIAGTSASGLPMTFLPPGTGDYTGGGFIMVMSADLTRRLLVTRVDASARARAVGVRIFDGEAHLAYGGSVKLDGDEFYGLNAIQAQVGGGERDGFLAVFAPGEMITVMDPEPMMPDMGTSPDMSASPDQGGVSDMSGIQGADMGNGGGDAGMSGPVPDAKEDGCGGCASTEGAPASPYLLALGVVLLRIRRRRSTVKGDVVA